MKAPDGFTRLAATHNERRYQSQTAPAMQVMVMAMMRFFVQRKPKKW